MCMWNACAHIHAHAKGLEGSRANIKKKSGYEKYWVWDKISTFYFILFYNICTSFKIGQSVKLKNVVWIAHTIINIHGHCPLCKGYVRNSLLRRL